MMHGSEITMLYVRLNVNYIATKLEEKINKNKQKIWTDISPK